MIGRELKLISGNANKALSQEISSSLGINLCATARRTFRQEPSPWGELARLINSTRRSMRNDR